MAEQLALGEAIIAIRAVGDQLQRDIQGIGAGVDRQLSPLRQKVQQLGDFGLQAGRLLATGIGAAATAAGAAATAVGALTLRVAANADEQTKLSQKLGIAIESLGGWQLAADLAGASSQEFTVGLRTIAQRAQDAQSGLAEAERSFESLGVKVTDADGKLRGIESIVLDVADRFVELEDGTEKAALAQELFGRGGAALIPLLNQGSDAIRAQIQEADELGLTFDLKTGKAAERLNDTILRLKSAGTGLLNEAITPLIPELADVAESTLAWVRENRALIAQNIKAVVDGIVASVKFLAPFVEAAAVSFAGFATSVSDFAESVRRSRLVQILGDLREAAQAISTLAPIAFAFRDGDPAALGRAISGAIDDIKDALTDANEEAETLTDTVGDRGRSGTLVGSLDAATDAVAELSDEIEPTAQEVEDADIAFENLMGALDEFKISAKDSEEAAGDLHEEVGQSDQVTRTALNDWRGFSEELTNIFGSLSGSFSRDFSQAIIAMDFDDLGDSLLGSLERMFGRVVERLIEAAIFDPLFDYLIGGLTGAGGAGLGGFIDSLLGVGGAAAGGAAAGGGGGAAGGAGGAAAGAAAGGAAAAVAIGGALILLDGAVGVVTEGVDDLGKNLIQIGAVIPLIGWPVALAGAVMELLGVGEPSPGERRVSRYRRRLASSLGDPEIGNAVGLGLEGLDIPVSEELLADSFVDAPKSGPFIREAFANLPEELQAEASAEMEKFLREGGNATNQLSMDDFLLTLFPDLRNDDMFRTELFATGLQAAFERGFKGTEALEFADEFSNGLLRLGSELGLTNEEMMQFINTVSTELDAPVQLLGQLGAAQADLVAQQGDTGFQTFLDEFARSLEQFSDADLDELLRADSFSGLFAEAAIEGEDFINLLQRFLSSRPEFAAFAEILEPILAQLEGAGEIDATPEIDTKEVEAATQAVLDAQERIKQAQLELAETEDPERKRELLELIDDEKEKLDEAKAALDDVTIASGESETALGDAGDVGIESGDGIKTSYEGAKFAIDDAKSSLTELRNVAQSLLDMGLNPALYLEAGGFTVTPPPEPPPGGGGGGGGGGGIGVNSFTGNPNGRILIEADPATYARLVTGPVLVEMRELGRRGDLSISGRRVTLHESIG